ncbi:hypothetical protein SUGI_0205770 [Cryptomeria japonica]|nr:hypothetical protein SUGI_0205770 [Cryptomeria japonica]
MDGDEIPPPLKNDDPPENGGSEENGEPVENSGGPPENSGGPMENDGPLEENNRPLEENDGPLENDGSDGSEENDGPPPNGGYEEDESHFHDFFVAACYILYQNALEAIKRSKVKGKNIKVFTQGTFRMGKRKREESPLRIREVSDDEQRNQPKEEKDYPQEDKGKGKVDPEEDPHSSSED